MAEKRLIFMADERIGSVRDIQLDNTRGQLWILGPDAAYVHDAGNLALLKHIPLESRDVAEMRIEEDGVTLLAADSVVLGRMT